MSNNYIKFQRKKMTLNDIFDELTVLHAITQDDPWDETIKNDFIRILHTHFYNNNLDFHMKDMSHHGLFIFNYKMTLVGEHFVEQVSKGPISPSHIQSVYVHIIGEENADHIPVFDPSVDDPYQFVKLHIFPLLKKPISPHCKQTGKKLGFRAKAKMAYQMLAEYKRASLPVEQRYLSQKEMIDLRNKISEMVLERETKDTFEMISIEQIYNRILPSLSFIEQLYAQNFISYLHTSASKRHSINGLDQLYFCAPSSLSFNALRTKTHLPDIPLTQKQLSRYSYLYAYISRYADNKREQKRGVKGRVTFSTSYNNSHDSDIKDFFRENLFGGIMTEQAWNDIKTYYDTHKTKIDVDVELQYEMISCIFDPSIHGRTEHNYGRSHAQHLNTIMGMLTGDNTSMQVNQEIELFME